MAKILIVNASPRAPRSNSAKYAALFARACKKPTEYVALPASGDAGAVGSFDDCDALLLTFPLYADSIPVKLLRFLQSLAQTPIQHKPAVSVLVNCGFLEHDQNNCAVRQIQLFCKEYGYTFGSVLKIGSGEAILDTPFRFLVKRKIARFARAVSQNKATAFAVTMPLTKRMFLRASTKYWLTKGAENGLDYAAMNTDAIEGN